MFELENLSTPFNYDDSSSDSLFDSFIDSSSFDQSFNLPDLHRLLEHFEEEHVLPLPHDDRPLYSSPVYAQPRPSGAHASYIISYPQPDPPLQPVSHPIPHHGAHRVLSDIDLPHIRSVPDLTHSPLSSSASTATSCYSSPTLDEPLCLPPALFTVQNTRSRTPPPSSDSDDDDDHDEPTPRERARGVGPQRTTKQYGSARADPIARSRPTVRTPERAPAPAHKKRDGREKQYKCPHPGCMKSYLNPNGLKYHLEKGTCTNADTRPRGPLPPPAESSPQTQTPAQTQTKTPALPSTVKIDVIDVPSGRSVSDVDAHSDDEADRT